MSSNPVFFFTDVPFFIHASDIALLLAAHKGLKLGRYFYGFTDNLLHCILELRRMGRFQEYARFAGFQSFGQGPEAAGSVRVEQVMVLLPHFRQSARRYKWHR